MATINAPTLLDTVYSGECPAALAHGSVALSGAAVADKVRLLRLFAGTKIYETHLVAGAMGTGATLSLGYEYCNGESGGSATAFANAVDTASAATSTRSTCAPVTLAYDAYLIATVGGGTSTGAVNAMVTYEFKGQ